MSKEFFHYDNIDHAVFDLKLFSSMNKNEDKPVYLFKTDEQYFIANAVVPSKKIVNIAINGEVFKPENSAS